MEGHSEGAASMGPPIFIGGNNGTGRAGSGRCAGLQWGRRFSSAEIPLRAVHAALAGHRFNGAADFHRRK